MVALTARERGFMLLTSHLGNPERKPLTVSQFRELAQRVRAGKRADLTGELEEAHLLELGYSHGFARHILVLLKEEAMLQWYLERADRSGCVPVTRASERYPVILRKRLGEDSPGVLWAKGDLSLLQRGAVALVGSRDLNVPNRRFAETVGQEAARQGLVLVSGNARGADKAAQEACLAAGGSVISVVADALEEHLRKDNVLYLSELDYDEAFSAQRALRRNRCIHALGQMTFVAQAALEKGGTWDGTVKNLRYGWSSVVCFRDGSEASRQLEAMGAYLAEEGDLKDLTELLGKNRNLLEGI